MRSRPQTRRRAEARGRKHAEMWRGAWLRRARVLAASPSVIRVKNAHATSPSASHWWRQHGVRSACDAANVTLDVFVRIEPEQPYGDEASVHGLGCLRTDAVVHGDIQDELEVGAVVERSAREDVARREGEDLVAIPFEFAEAGPVVFPVGWEGGAALQAGDGAEEGGEPCHKSFERREPWGFACRLLRVVQHVIHACSICSGQAGVGRTLSKTRRKNCRALAMFSLF